MKPRNPYQLPNNLDYMSNNFYISENLISTKDGASSPSKKYNVLIETYKTKENSRNYTRGVIINSESKEIIFNIDNDYSYFLHGWVIYKSKEYLFCSRNYTGHSCIDIENKKIFNWDPLEDTFFPFCWSGPWLISPDEKTLAIKGFYCSTTDEIKFYDLSNGIDMPLKELNIVNYLENGENIFQDIIWENSDFNDELYDQYVKNHGKNFYENRDLLNELSSLEKDSELKLIWNDDNSFSELKAYRNNDIIIVPNNK